jgi:hypothetical protein
MHLNLKSAMAAVALALLASTANAALPAPNSANGSDLILNIWDGNLASQGFTYDTGLSVATWNPAAAFSVTITNAGVLASFNDTVNGGTTGTVWDVVGARTTGAGAGNTFWTTVVDPTTLGAAAGDVASSIGAAVTASSTAFLAQNSNQTSQSSDAFWAGQLAAGAGNISAVTELLGPGTQSFARYNQGLSNLVSVYAGTWALTWNAAAGSATSATLTWTPSAVPIPAALWLLGSGLLGVAGVGRRRQVRPV